MRMKANSNVTKAFKRNELIDAGENLQLRAIYLI